MRTNNGFIEERLTECASFGTTFTWSFNTSIHELTNKHEVRRRVWLRPRLRATIVFENLRGEARAEVVNAFLACAGRLIGFRVKCPLDYQVDRAFLCTSTSGEQRVQLQKTYIMGLSEQVIDIKKPVSDTIELYADGEPILSAVDYSTGMVTFTAEEGAEIRWSGEYDFAMRFDSDDLDFTINSVRSQGENGDVVDSGQYYVGSSVDLVEIDS